MLVFTFLRVAALSLSLNTTHPAINRKPDSSSGIRIEVGTAVPAERIPVILQMAANLWNMNVTKLQAEYDAGMVQITELRPNLYQVERSGGENILVIWSE